MVGIREISRPPISLILFGREGPKIVLNMHNRLGQIQAHFPIEAETCYLSQRAPTASTFASANLHKHNNSGL